MQIVFQIVTVWFYYTKRINYIYNTKSVTMKKLLFFISIVFSLTYSASAQKIGGKVKVMDFGNWISGTLLSIKDGQYFVTFDDKYYKDRLVKEKDIVFLDGAAAVVKDTVFKVRRDTVYIKKTQRDTILNVRRDTVSILKTRRDTIFNTKRDTVTILKTKRDTIFTLKRDTFTVLKVVKDTIFKYKRDTVLINRTIKDTIINKKTETVTVTSVKAPAFRLGDLVLAYKDAEWKPAVILEIKSNDVFKVKYDGLSDYYNSEVGIGSIKLRNNAEVSKLREYKLGDLVQVYDDGEWKPAVILEIKGGDLFKVKFDGLSDYYNKVVGVGSIKAR